MIKKAIIAGALGVYSLCAFSPFAVSIAGADLPPSTLATNTSVIDWVGLTTISGKSTYYGENTVVNGVFGVMSTRAGHNSVGHAVQSFFGGGSASSNNVVEYTDNGRYGILTNGAEWESVRFYFNGFTPTDILTQNSNWEFEFVTDEENIYIAYSTYMAWFPVVDTETELSVRGIVNHSHSLGNIRTIDNHTALIDFDYPAEIWNFDVIYMQYWIEFYTIATGPTADNAFPFSLRAPIGLTYTDYGDYRTLIGIEFYSPPIKYDFAGIIVDNVESFLSFEIFPGFSFYNILFLVFAVTFFGFILRAFLGG